MVTKAFRFMSSWVRLVKNRLKGCFESVHPDIDISSNSPANERSTSCLDISKLSQPDHEESVIEHDLARMLALAIKQIVNDLYSLPPKRYILMRNGFILYV